MDQPPTSEERMAEKQNYNQHDCKCPGIEHEEDHKKCTGSRGGGGCEQRMVRRAYCGPLHVPKALLGRNVFPEFLLDNPMSEIGQELRQVDGLRSMSGRSIAFRSFLVDTDCHEGVPEE
jgi:hypothetical protein